MKNIRRRRLDQIPRLVLCSSCLLLIFFIVDLLNSNAIETDPSLGNNADFATSNWHKRSVLSKKEVTKAPGRNSKQVDSNDSMKCFPAAIEQFPRPLMSPQTRRSGGILVHFLVSMYTFLALAILCDEYFVPSLERICEVLNLSSDVAGATFMAAGSSAPELAASVIGIFISKDDIGLGTVVGSAVFNITFVISICGLFSGLVIQLSWWPLVRDSIFYMLSVLLLALFLLDGFIEWYESMIMLLGYVLYIVIMYHDSKLHMLVQRLLCKHHVSTVKIFDRVEEESQLINGKTHKPKDVNSNPEVLNSGSFTEIDTSNLEKSTRNSHEEEEINESSGLVKKFIDIVSVPLVYSFYYTVPDCREDRWSNYYAVTLVISIVWISFYSYILVWMITIIGSTFFISDVIMGLTFLAAGVSLPDAFSSLSVAKKGLGDMAISNAIGSNVFDILLCLGLPWFLKTTLVTPGTPVTVYNKGLLYSTASLFATVVFLLVATHLNNWSLTKRYGIVLLVWYFLFTVSTTIYELNIFGVVSLSPCPTDF